MPLYSFIDQGLQDFLRDDNGDVIKYRCANSDEAESYLLDELAHTTDWTNKGTNIWDWDEASEEGEGDDD